MNKKLNTTLNYTSELESFLIKTKKDLEKKISMMISDEDIKSILENGKRLRPLFSHLSFKVCTQGKETENKYQKSLECAVVIELAHGASLVHDDIIDQDKERRGKPSYYLQKNTSSALLIGHKMIAIGLKIAIEHGIHFGKLYVEAWDKAVVGAIDELNFNTNNDNVKKFSKEKIFETYDRIIDLKTASLFTAACKAGAIEAKSSKEIMKIIAEYGREVGYAYQIADDLIDLKNGEIVNAVILPLFKRMNNGSDKLDDIEEIKKYIDKNSNKIEKIFIKEIKKHIKNAEKLSQSSLLPNSHYKELYKILPSYVVNKSLEEANISI